jgi:hypothetical protein
MVAEMSPDLFRDRYLVPMKTRYGEFFNAPSGVVSPHMYMKMTGQAFVGNLRGDISDRSKRSKSSEKLHHKIMVSLSSGNDFYQFVSSLQNVSGFQTMGVNVPRSKALKDDSDEDFFVDALDRYSLNSKGVRLCFDREDLYLIDADGKVISESWIAERFLGTYMYQYSKFHAEEAYRFVNAEAQEYGRVTSSFDELFAGASIGS